MMKKLLAFLVLVLLPAAASAQAPMIPRPGGISINGYGSIRVAVKTVQFTAQVRGVGDESGALAAMRAAGIDEPAIGLAGSRVASGALMLVRGTVHDVTHAKLDRIEAAAAAYVTSHPGVTIDNVSFSPRLDDCAAAEQAGRAAAFADARRKADAIAALAGVSIDAVASVSENGGCPSIENSFNGPGLFDLGTLTTTITVTEYVTYAISPGTPSTRRRTL